MEKLAYLTHMRLPTEKAYGIQMVNTAKALTENGMSVTFVGTNRANTIKEDIFTYYGFSKDVFTYYQVFSLKLFSHTRFGFWLNMLSFSLSASAYIYRKKIKIIYSREPFPILFLKWLGCTTVYEVHDHPKKDKWFHRLICKNVSFVLVTNEYAYKTIVDDLKISSSKVLLVPNGFDIKKFNLDIDQVTARSRVDLPITKKIVLYAGHLYDWKGAKILIELASQMQDVVFCVVGGSQEDHRNFVDYNLKPKNLILIQHQKPELIPYYLAAANVLVLPNLPINSHSQYSTSPIKLFEYMASKRIVVASDLPSIRSIVTENEVIFAEPGNLNSWKKKIEEYFSEELKYRDKINNARTLVEQFSWQNKARRIINFISKKDLCVE